MSALSLAVSEGAAPSKNALVERALVKELRDLKREARRKAWQEAVRDPLYVRDVQDVEAAFRTADAESTGGMA